MTKVSWGIKAAKIAPDNKIKPTAALVAVNNMKIVSQQRVEETARSAGRSGRYTGQGGGGPVCFAETSGAGQSA